MMIRTRSRARRSAIKGKEFAGKKNDAQKVEQGNQEDKGQGYEDT